MRSLGIWFNHICRRSPSDSTGCQVQLLMEPLTYETICGRECVKTRIPLRVLFVLVRVISWIVPFTSPKRTIHEITRTNTKRSNAQIRRQLRVSTLTLLVFTIPGCRSNEPSSSGTASPSELTVSAAVSLKDAFNEIAKLNEKRTGTKIHFNYGASGALQKQIESGAPVDVFASAGAKQMDDLAAKSFIIPSTGRRARNSRNSPSCRTVTAS